MDTLGTAAIRERVLAAWAASPARFREDANAEEELALGAYRDRLVVELAQNAADAAVRAGVPGRLLLHLDRDRLLAANTGAPLDADGVEGLSTLRASPKRSETSVGRFGVGFAAVLGVTDEPAVLSISGGVRWSRTQAHRLVSGLPELAAELAHRGGSVPVLRLPFAADPAEFADATIPGIPTAPATAPASAIPPGYDTAVVLPLRDATAAAATRELLDAVDDALPLVLTGLNEIVIEVDGERRTIVGTPPEPVSGLDDIWERHVGTRRWRLARLTGQADPGLLADRPAEERMRPDWSVTVAVPTDQGGAAPAPLPPSMPTVLHAPTPTDDRTDLPALIIADFPLDSSRRRVAPGRFTDHLVDRIGVAYGRIVASFRTPAALTLVPGPIGAGELDATLHRSVHQVLIDTAFIPAADGDARLRAAEVTLVDGLNRTANPLTLAPLIPGLPAPGWWRMDVLRRLGAAERPLPDLVDELGGLDLPASRWFEIYAALDGADVESLGALPVPLADGRLIRGPRSVLLPGDVDPGLLEPFRLRVVHPDAAHPLLGRLGAAEATARSVLGDPAVRATVLSSGDEETGSLEATVADAVLQLVTSSGLSHDDEPWLSQLPLPDAAGSHAPAHDLLLPSAALLRKLDVDPAEYAVHDDVLRRHGESTLRAVGVRDGFGVVRDADVPLDDEMWHDLDGEHDWLTATLDQLPPASAPAFLTELAAIRDLDLIRPSAWPEVLSWLAAEPGTRSAVVDPAYAMTADGGRHTVEPYTSWWLRMHARIDGRPLHELCTTDADPAVRALLHPVALAADDAFLATLGIVRSLDQADADTLLNRLLDESASLTAAQLMDIYTELARREPGSARPPRRLRVPHGDGSHVVDAAQVVVCDGPHWLQLRLPAVVPGPAELAELLDVDLAGDAYDTTVSGDGQWQPVPDLARQLIPEVPDTYLEHDDLTVAGMPVDWWVQGETVHAATPDGLARGLAWAAGAWDRRWLLIEALQDPSALPTLLAEETFE